MKEWHKLVEVRRASSKSARADFKRLYNKNNKVYDQDDLDKLKKRLVKAQEAEKNNNDPKKALRLMNNTIKIEDEIRELEVKLKKQ